MVGRKKKKRRFQEEEPILEQDPNAGVNEVFENRKKRNEERSFQKNKNRLYLLAMFSGILIVGFFWWITPSSKIRSIAVFGTHYLTEDYIRSLTGVNLDTRWITVWDGTIEHKVEASPMVATCSVRKTDQGALEITIEEQQPVGYRYQEEPELILLDGTTVPLLSEYLNVIAYVPYVSGFTEEEQLVSFAKAFRGVNQSEIESMAEITQYSTSYDDAILQIFMRDGNWFYASYFSLPVINSYNQFISNLEGSGYCIYSEDNQQVAYTSTCPWDTVVEEKEYWTYESGEFILNQYGDRIVKHYYTDEEGAFVLDENGERIPIPWWDPEQPLGGWPEEPIEGEETPTEETVEETPEETITP